MNKTIFFSLWALLISSTPAMADSALQGKWKQTDIFCEGGESFYSDTKPTKIQMIINKTSVTKITDFSRAMEITNCSLLTSANYSINNDQFTQGPFFGINVPKLPQGKSISATRSKNDGSWLCERKYTRSVCIFKLD